MRRRAIVGSVLARHGTPEQKDRWLRPIGAGTIKVLATLVDQDTMTGTFKISTSRGSASGTVDTQYVIEGSEITFTGTATFTRGTGRYKEITGKKLDVYAPPAARGRTA